MPAVTPTAPPMSARRIASERNWVRMFRFVTRGERGRGLADLHLVGRLRVGGGGEDRLDRRCLARNAADVDRGRMAVKAKVALGCGEADEYGAVDLGRKRRRVEDAGEVEPHPSEPNALTRVEPVDPEPLGGRIAEHGDRLARRGHVEIL